MKLWHKVGLGAGLVLGMGLTVVLLPNPEPEPSPPPPRAKSRVPRPPLFSTPFITPGARCPPARPAAAVDVPDDAPVVGVVVESKARAYLLTAMKRINYYVINDLVGDCPVTVTYCDKSDCVCAFTDDTRGTPLAMDLGGWSSGKMVVRVQSTFYWQDSGVTLNPDDLKAIPYAPLPHERATWKAWKQAHPETDVFVGP